MMLDMLPSYIYIAIKYQLLQFQFTRTLPPKLTIFVSLALSVLVVPVAFCIICACFAYKTSIDLILRWKHKDQYRGQMGGVDSVCCNQVCCTPSFFMLIDYDKSHEDLKNEFIHFLKHRCRYPRHQKIFFSWSTCMGYHYYYKNTMKVEDYVTLAQNDATVIRSKKDFSDVILQYDTAPMPDDNRALFQVIVYPQEVRLPHADSDSTKLVCFKMHHALGDARAILSLIIADFADKNTEDDGHKGHNGNSNGYLGKEKVETPANEDYLERVKRTLLDDHIKAMPTSFCDDNILSGKSLSEEKYICWFSDHTSEYMDKIRAIRRARPGVAFLDVVNTCLSASLHDYYTKHSTDIPSMISAGVVLSPAKYSFQYGDTNYTLSNEFSLGGFRFPIDVLGNDLLAKLNFCHKEYQMIKDSVDVRFFYWVSDVFSLLPYQIPKFCSEHLMSLTIGVSSLPGPEHTISLFGGNEVRDIILMPPNSPGTALHFVICSYGKNLRMALTIDKSVMATYEDGQAIVDGVVKYLDLLHVAVSEHE